MKRILIVGVGRPNHGDDAAGIALARRLGPRLQDIARVKTDVGSGFTALEACEHEHLLVILDAAQEHAKWPAGSWCRICFPEHASALVEHRLRDTHTLSIDGMLRLGQALGRLPAAVCIYALAGRSFNPETPLSPEVDGMLDRIAEQVEHDVREWLEVQEEWRASCSNPVGGAKS